MASVYRMGLDTAPAPGRSTSLSEKKANDIGEMLATDVIPKLLVAHREDTIKAIWQLPVIDADEPARLAPMAVECEAHVLLERVEEIMRGGIGTDRILVELLAPAARRLGRDWDADRIDFVQVSMGLWRLQEVMRELTARSTHAHPGGPGKTALFLAMPGDNHSFGASMVHECFVMAGWDADLLIGATQSELLDRVANNDIDLVGLTVSCDCHIERLPSLIRGVRSVSVNPSIRLMIGGRIANVDPGIVARVGADGTADSATEAVIAAEQLVKSVRLTAVS